MTYPFPYAGDQNILLMIATGVGIGFLAGLFGVGGGFITVPILNLIYGINIYVAKGTDLFTILFTTISAGWRHNKSGFVSFKIALCVGLSSLITAWTGSVLSFGLPRELFKLFFGLLLLFVAGKMLGFFEFSKEESVSIKGRWGFYVRFADKDLFISLPRAIAIGIILGLFSGFFGVGGGVILVPMLYYILKMPMHLVIGTSVCIVWLTALSGTAAHWIEQKVDWQLGLILATGTVIGAYLGAILARHLDQEKLKRYFAVVIVVASLKMIADSLSKLGWL